MPYKDPEVARTKGRGYTKASRERNREKVNARTRELRAQNRDKANEYLREWRSRNREKVREQSRTRQRAKYATDPGYREQRIAKQREYNTRNRDEIRQRERQRYHMGGREQMRVWRMQFKHGLRPEDWAAMWDAQQGLCYLCGEGLIADKAVVEHDHSCCPQEASCRTCRRGLTHSNCNSAIGLAGDDPARLRRMADALEAAQLAVNRRKDAAAEQLILA